jgi:hypothetical protein
VIDFNLNLIENNGGIFAHASAGPEGSLGQAYRFIEPQETSELDRIRCRAEALIQNSPGAERRDLDAPSAGRQQLKGTEKELADLGLKLFGLIFQDKMKELYVKARAAVRNGQDEALLVLLKLEPLSSLQQIPWEILHDDHCFLAKDARTAMVRFFEQVTSVSRLEVEPPLRVLLTSANPQGTAPLALDEEEEAIRLAYEEAGPLVELVVIRNLSLDKLKNLWLKAGSRGTPFHVWHHCGHGGRMAQGEGSEFVLWLEEDGHGKAVTVEQLQEIVEFCPELRIAIFNVCRGGSTSGIVPVLAGINVPVVIGFQHAVHDNSALQFATALHDSLLYIPVEFALSLARKYVKVDGPRVSDWSHALAFSRRRDRGMLLRKPEARTPRKALPKKTGSSKGGVTMDIGKIKGEEVNVIGVQSFGHRPPAPHEAPSVQMKVSEIQGTRVQQIGFQHIGGFSIEEVESREAKLNELMRRLGQRLAGGPKNAR